MENKPQPFDEMLSGEGPTTAPYADYNKWFESQDADHLSKKSKEAETFFRRSGITFNVYGQAEAQERLIPFDLVPRIIAEREWARLSRGIEALCYGVSPDGQ